MSKALYSRWRSLLRESFDLLDPDWRRYLVFERYVRDLGPQPSTIHRLYRLPDPHGRFEPGNFRWGTPAEYQRALEEHAPEALGCRLLTIDGVTKPISRWASERGLSPGTITERLKKGCPPEKAILPGILRDGPAISSVAPSPSSKVTGENNGKAKLTDEEVRQARDLFRYGYSYKDLAQEYKVSYQTIYNAVRGFKWRHILDNR